MNRISFLNRGYAFKGLLAVYMWAGQNGCAVHGSASPVTDMIWQITGV